MAISNKLYPPIIKSVLPAFYKESNTFTIKIPFTMNKMVGINNVTAMFLRLKTVQTNQMKLCVSTKIFNLEQGIVTFIIENADTYDLTPGVFYKAQLAYWYNEDANKEPNITTAGYFSTVGIIKYITKPKVEIANLSAGVVNRYNNRFLGVYSQDAENGDISEKVYSYCFTITDEDNNIYLTSGTQLHNVNNDVNSWSSEDEFVTHKSLILGQVYCLQYTITTINGLELASPLYYIMEDVSIDMWKHIDVLPELNYDEGYIQINFQGPIDDYVDLETRQHWYITEVPCTGLFLLSRASAQDDYTIWHDIARFSLTNTKPSTHSEYDFTIEQGITYKYRLQQYNTSGVYSNPVYSKEIYADFEDMFLYDGVRQLKVRFNPKVSSFKVDIPEQKLETIGSKYPFIFRNGNVYYHEFPISGLISYQLDEAKLFLNADEIDDGNILEQNTITSLYYQKIPQNQIRLNRDLTSDNLMSERYFKLAVLNWLTNGEVKLFRSPGEGNYLVRLLNTSMTPNDTLGRMLHTFNTTAYEIDDLTYNNLLKYNLISAASPEVQLRHYITTEFSITDKNETGKEIYKNNGDDIIYTFEVNDCMPGDSFDIIYVDKSIPKDTITIGVTGSYKFVGNGNIIGSIIFHSPNKPTYPHYITLEMYQLQQSYFDLIANVNSQSIVARTFYGENRDIINLPVGDNSHNLQPFDTINQLLGAKMDAYKIKLKNVELLHVRAREIIPLYRWQETPTSPFIYATTPFGVGYPLEELQTLTTGPVSDNAKMLSQFAIFKVYTYTNEQKPSDVPHLINNITADNQDVYDVQLYNEDELYYEMYPNWEFTFYWDPLLPSNKWNLGTTKPDTRFAINKIKESNEFDYIDLSREREITLYDLGQIPYLYLGNGVMAEVTMRIQVIDYTIEDTNTIVKTAKQLYLAARKQIFEDYNTRIGAEEDEWVQYNTYLTNLSLLEQAENELTELNSAIQILEGLTQDPEVQNLQLVNNFTDAKNTVNTYRIDFVDYWNNIINRPATITNLETPNAFSDLDEATIDVRKTALATYLDSLDTFFLTALSNFANNIPSITDINPPLDWNQDIADIRAELENAIFGFILNIDPSIQGFVNILYNLLAQNSSANNPFTETWYNNNITLNGNNWSTTNINKIITLLTNVSYTDILSYELSNDITINNYKGDIINSWNILQEKNEALTEANENVEEKQNELDTLNTEFSNNADVSEYLQLENEINQLRQDILDLQASNNSINSLIESLEHEEQTDETRTAIRYLELLKATNLSSISLKQSQIVTKQARRTELQSGYNVALDAIRTAEGELAQLRADAAQAQTQYNEAEQAFVNNINEWNNTLTSLNSYMTILTQIVELQELMRNNLDLNQQISLYWNSYYDLQAKQNELSNNAAAAIKLIEDTAGAFATFDSLLTAWRARYTTLDNERAQLQNLVDNATQTTEPISTTTQLETNIAIMKDCWNNFITELRTAYEAIEERYQL